jgi:hypothetical protein
MTQKSRKVNNKKSQISTLRLFIKKNFLRERLLEQTLYWLGNQILCQELSGTAYHLCVFAPLTFTIRPKTSP